MEQERRSDAAPIVATVLYLLFLPLYPITASLMDEVTSNTVIAVATVANVLVTAVYAFFTWHLWRQTRVAADAARKGADASVESTAVARQALVEVQRAYMFVKAFRADVDRDAQARPTRWRIVTEWENFGQTPAVAVTLISMHEKIPRGQPQDFRFPTAADFVDGAAVVSTPIAPGSGMNSSPVPVDLAEVTALARGDLTMVIGGRVQYTDILTGMQRHTEICASVLVDPHMVGQLQPFRFHGYPRHNSHT
jgi:hypothetical protein